MTKENNGESVVCAWRKQNDDDLDREDDERGTVEQGLQSEWRVCEDEFGNESSTATQEQGSGRVLQAFGRRQGDTSEIKAIWGALQVFFYYAEVSLTDGRELSVKYVTEGEGHVHEGWEAFPGVWKQICNTLLKES